MRLLRSLVASAAIAVAAAYVPPHMKLPSTWTDVSTGTLVPLEFKSEAAAAVKGDAESTVTESACMSAADVISKHSGRNGAALHLLFDDQAYSCFLKDEFCAVRKAKVTIADLAAREDKPLHGFRLFGVVKEVGVDDAGLTDFRENFSPYPLYRDEETIFYNALGARKIALKTWNPLRLFRGMRDIGKRLKAKGITGNYKGEGVIQGGIIIFDKNGVARYAYREETGYEVPIEDIIAAVKAVKAETS
ncbi:hypothetical protein ACHAXR_007781 [Thalassiosira sp. AJA248-18]